MATRTLAAGTNVTLDASVGGVLTINVAITSLAWSAITGTPTTRAGYGITDAAALSHTHPASDISDSTSAGRAVLTAADAAAQRTALGLGTAATSASSAFAAAVHTHAESDITGLTSDLAAKAPLASPALTGTPTAPTAVAGTNTTQLATTAFVTTAVAGATAGVSSFNGRTGAVTPASGDYAVADVTGAAPLASPTFTGTPAAPTATTGTNTTQIATTAFVEATRLALATVARTGVYSDLTGKPTLGTAAALDVPASGNAASGEVVKGSDTRLTDARTPSSTLAHAASHASAGSDPLTLAQSQVTNLTTDLAAKAPLASPTFTGTPAAPTATAGTNTTQVATTAFVAAAVAAGGGGGSVDPTEYTRRTMTVVKSYFTTTWQLDGLGAAVTLSTLPTITSADDDEGPWGVMTTGAVSGNNLYVSLGGTGGGPLRLSLKPVCVGRVKLPSSMTNHGFWVGLTASSGSAINSATPNVAMASFRYFPATDTTGFWACVTRDGVNVANVTTTTTTVAATADTAYTLRVDYSDGANVKFYINSTLVATHTTNLPPTSTQLHGLAYVTTQAAAAATLKAHRVWASHT